MDKLLCGTTPVRCEIQKGGASTDLNTLLGQCNQRLRKVLKERGLYKKDVEALHLYFNTDEWTPYVVVRMTHGEAFSLDI